MDKWPTESSASRDTTSHPSTIRAARTTKPMHDSEDCAHCQKVKGQADNKKVWAIVAIATDGWDTTTLRTEQLSDNDVEPSLQEVEGGQCLE
jgi:hypothetical protein